VSEKPKISAARRGETLTMGLAQKLSQIVFVLFLIALATIAFFVGWRFFWGE
jgi:hypothetical protein